MSTSRADRRCLLQSPLIRWWYYPQTVIPMKNLTGFYLTLSQLSGKDIQFSSLYPFTIYKSPRTLHMKLEKIQLSSIHTTIFFHNCNNSFNRFIIYMGNNVHHNVFRKIFAVLSLECKGLNRYFFRRSTMHRSVHPRQVFQNSPKSLSLYRSRIGPLQAQLKVFVIRRVNQQLWS